MLLVAAISAGAGLWQRRGRERRAATTVAGELGLTSRRSRDLGGFGGIGLDGTVDGIPVAVESVGRAKATKYTARGAPYGVQLRARGVLDGVVGVVTGSRVEVGDPAFDRMVEVDGDPRLLTALLDVDTRLRLIAFFGGGGRDCVIQEGAVSRTVRTEVKSPQQVRIRLEEVAEIARTLRTAEQDPDAALRRVADADPCAQVRLHACRYLGDAAGLVRVGTAPGEPDALRAEALEAALVLGGVGVSKAGRSPDCDGPDGRSPDEDGLVEALRRAVVDDAESAPVDAARVRHAALTLLWGMDPHAARAAWAALEHQGPVGRRVYAALAARVAAAHSEAALLVCLGDADAEVRLAATRGLGEVGTARAVLPLRGLTGGALAVGAQAQAAYQAIVAIQGRLGAVEPGRLALAVGAGPEGALSEAVDEGRVSLPVSEEPP